MTLFTWQHFTNSNPTFIADHGNVPRDTGRQIDWSRVPDTYKMGTAYTITANGAALAGATSITVDATPVALPVGATLDFLGVGEFATLTAPAAAGATTLTVEALDAGIEDNDTATYLVSISGAKAIPAGTVMCALASKLMIPRAARTGAETAFCLLASNAIEDAPHNALSGFGCILGGVMYENLLPDFSNASWATFKTELQAAGVSTGFSWRTYEDTRAA